MNRKDLRDAAGFERAMIINPNDSVKIARLNTLLDLAVRRVAGDYPETFIPDKEYIVLLPDMTDKTEKVTIATTADPYVLQFSGIFGTAVFPTDGSWDGLYHIEVSDSNGTTIHRYQSREFWKAANPLAPSGYDYYVSLTRPVSFAESGLAWRLHMPTFWLSSDVARINEGTIYLDGQNMAVPLPQAYFISNRRLDYRGGQNSQPNSFYRDQHFQIDAPSRVPAVTAAGGLVAVWGPEPIGTFEYCYTYCWGHRDVERLAPGGYAEPVWESAPSPVTDVVTIPDTTYTALLTLPDIAWMTNFNVAGTLRQSHSGLYKRLYRRRLTTGTTPAHGSIEAPGAFQHLAFVDDATTTFVDDGTLIPDYYRRVPESQGYYAWTPWPHQDKRYELDLYVQRTPRALANDSDAPRIHSAHLPMLVQAIAARFAAEDNDAAGVARHEAEYARLAREYSKQQGNPSRYTPPQPWGGFSPRLRFLPVTSD